MGIQKAVSTKTQLTTWYAREMATCTHRKCATKGLCVRGLTKFGESGH